MEMNKKIRNSKHEIKNSKPTGLNIWNLDFEFVQDCGFSASDFSSGGLID
jgi:hypothetical protein